MPGIALWVLGVLAAGFTSFYVWRSYFLAFGGAASKPEQLAHMHEAPRVMTDVLALLALGSTVLGVVLGVAKPHGHALLESWLEPSLAHPTGHARALDLGLEVGLAAVSLAVAFVAYRVARARYGDGRSATWAEDERRLPFFGAIQAQLGIDAAYQIGRAHV